MYRIFSAAFLLACFQGCTSFRNDIRFATPDGVSIRRVDQEDLGYLLTHLEIVAESPLPHLLPGGSKCHYRIMGVTKQGDCIGGCPPSTIFVTIWNYSDYRDGHIQLYRIDGVRFWHFAGVQDYKPSKNDGPFLSFRFQSRPAPGETQDYLAKIGFGRIAISRL